MTVKKPQQNAQAGQVGRYLPPLASAWVRYLLGFSVSVGVGLAPYLGRVHVPLFTPLLAIIPLSLQDIAIPVSAASMGLVAVFVQWRKASDVKAWEFQIALGSAIAALILLIAIEMIGVAHVEVPAVNGKVSFAVGFSTPNKPPCVGLGRDECITKKLSLDEANIDSYFGDSQTGIAKLALVLTYVGFTALFGLTVGLLVVRESKA